MTETEPSDETNPETESRPRGVLTPTDRQWIMGDIRYDSRQGENKRKREVHERIRNAILDLELLLEYPGTIDLDRIYNTDDSHGYRAVRATEPAIAFLLRHKARHVLDSNPLPEVTKTDTDGLEKTLSASFEIATRDVLRVDVRSGLDAAIPAYDVRVETAIRPADDIPEWLQQIKQGIEEGVRQGAIDPDDVSIDTPL